jgi:soluble lytic murein transglycosylase-like protein
MRTAAYVIVAILIAGPAQASGIYRYVDKDGTIVYTNVPPKNAKAKKLKGTFSRAPSVVETSIPKAASKLTLAEFEEHIALSARKYKVPVHLVRAVMHAESNFDPNAVSPVGASGLMQLMPGTAREMYVKDIFDVRENIEGGTRYLRVLANMFNGDMVKMVAAYNAGPEAVMKYGGKVPPYPETQQYVRKVIDLYFQYKGQEPQFAENEPAPAP